MIEVVRSEIIRCTPEDWLDLVLDVHRYATVDDKIGRIRWVRRDGDGTEFLFTPLLPGVPLPGPPIVSQMRLVPGERVDVQLPPLARNRLSRATVRFAASFSGAAVREGTRVTRSIRFDFAPAVRWLLEPRVRAALPGSVERELRLAKQLLEGGDPTSG